VKEVTFGLATNITIHCAQCKRYNGADAKLSAETNEVSDGVRSDLCKYAINLKYCISLQMMGVGGENASVLAAFLDLPDPTNGPDSSPCWKAT